MSLISIVLISCLGSTSLAGTRPKDRKDPLLSKQWGLQRVLATQAWSYAKGKGVRVAVIDTGIDLQHPDLLKNLSSNGHNLIEPGNTPDDDNGHGTHVAGIIAAVANNRQGIAGVAPKAELVPIKVCDADGFCDDLDIAEGIRSAIRSDVDVINLSLGLGLVTGKVSDDAREVRDAVKDAQEAGMIVVAAAGNYSLPVCQEPASYAICVGATGPDDTRAFYSNNDATMTVNFLVAPGGDGHTLIPGIGECDSQIISTYPLDIEPSSCDHGLGYAGLSGSSMAAPHVSGVAALLLSQGLDPAGVIRILLDTADDLGAPGRDPIYGYGRANALRAVESAAQVTKPDPQ